MHEGHRARMRDRFMANRSFSGFSEFEFLEMLLYYSKPRGDTNPCAHELIDRFGTVKDVFEASVDELCGVRGMGESSAILIKMITEGMRRYAADLFADVERYDCMSKVRNYLYRLFLGMPCERLYILLFNDRMNLLDCVLLSEGSVNSSNVPMRLLVEQVVQKKATGIILAHNHPNGVAVPSSTDLEITDQIKAFLDTMDATLIEHFIVSGVKFWPIMRHCYDNYRVSPVSGLVESSFYDFFYDLNEQDYGFPPLFDSAEQGITNSHVTEK